MAKTIYLDNAATTMVDPKVAEAMNAYNLDKYGNASSTHHKGDEAHKAMEQARSIIAKAIGAKSEEIIFTSGGTEANNFAIKGIAFANKDKNHIVTTKIEHDCILNSCKWLESQGFKITYLNVDKEGFVSAEELEKSITDKTILVSIIHGNNEIGTIQDLKSLYSICKKHKVLLHTDACQSFTKTEVNVQMADMITLNAHKIHGPKGIGALFIKKGIKITPLMHGGGHEKNMRSGTENIPGIVGFGKSVETADKNNIKKMTELRDYLIEQLLKIPDTKLNGPKGEKRLCNNANVSFRYIEGESIVGALDMLGICVSTGSACSSHTLDPSHVIMALEKNHERAHGSIRFTISKYTNKEEIDIAVRELKKIVDKLRSISPIKN